MTTTAVKWVNRPDAAPWWLRTQILHTNHLKNRDKKWEIQHVLRSANSMADSLAKAAVGREQDLLQVHQVDDPLGGYNGGSSSAGGEC